MALPSRLGAIAIWAALACAPVLGCRGNPGAESDVAGATPSERTSVQEAALSGPVTRSQVLANAQRWVTAELLYCQSANGQPDGDTSCSPTCERQSNAEWDPYRSDCSGFISWAWELPPPGLVTSEFAPYDTSASSVIACADLLPGDAANRDPNEGHIVLFEAWVTPGQEALFMEEPGCSSTPPYAHEFDSTVTCTGNSIDIDYEGDTFTAIRYTNIVDDPSSCAAASASCSADGDCCAGLTCQSGVCVADSTCESMWTACTSADQCCSGLTCLTWTPDGESAGTYCCEGVGAACTDGRQCCGGVNCTNGVCACVPSGAYCQNDADCCDGLTCQNGSCAAAPGTGTTGSTGSGTSTTAASTTAASSSTSSGSTSTAATTTGATSPSAGHSTATETSSTSGGSGTRSAASASSSGGAGTSSPATPDAGGQGGSVTGGCAAAPGDGGLLLFLPLAIGFRRRRV